MGGRKSTQGKLLIRLNRKYSKELNSPSLKRETQESNSSLIDEVDYNKLYFDKN